MAATSARILLATLALLLTGAPACAADAPIRLVTGNGYPPFSDASLPEGGFATAAVRLTMREMGEPVEISVLPWKRGLLATLQGQFAGTFPYIHSTAREAEFLFSDPLYLLDNRVYVPRGSPLNYRSPQDLVGKVACNQLGAAHAQVLQQMIDAGQVRLETPRTLGACFLMLLARRVDFVSVSQLVGDAAIREAVGDLGRFTIVGPPVGRVSLCLMVPKRSPDGARFLQRFNAALTLAKRDPEWNALEQRFLQPPARNASDAARP